ncbi:hypothetical protein [Paraburkholderia phenazinium]|jgi:hypothetical protein|uniref:Sulfotransferase family protein n=1 Tax=Paraburkholderia phenazinium TaxID=60549 RepID=A0A1G7VDM0_9BURK|nr:hypothetical protein [Paraburkholderia phenazinium]SDG57658.1 hypothetical protein SAMN05216466_10419 [Paraburkholderia phenazinium]
MPGKHFIFPITTGRSGTLYLTELLRRNLHNAEVHHERAGHTDLGVHHPDASDFTHFNTFGNDAHVQQFWTQKLHRIVNGPARVYAEISHPLVKAGLIENIAPLTRSGRVDLIILRRNTEDILWSLANRFDFVNNAFTWLFYLDPRYRNVIVNATPFISHGMYGAALWYIHEMWTRVEYYRRLLADDHDIYIHDVELSEIATGDGAMRLLRALGAAPTEIDLPPQLNATSQTFFGDDIRQGCHALVQKFQVDHAAEAIRFLEEGRRLASGPTAGMSVE